MKVLIQDMGGVPTVELALKKEKPEVTYVR